MIDSPRVCIQVQSIYVESQSIPEEERYVFAYTITIRNLGRTDVQLLGRYWLITNSNGRQTEVQGEGVIGEPARHSARRRVSVHQRRHSGNAAGHHGRPLRNG